MITDFFILKKDITLQFANQLTLCKTKEVAEK